MPVFTANAGLALKNCYSLTLSLVDGSATTVVYSDGTSWYSDSGCTKTTSLTIPRRTSDNAIPVFFKTSCSSRATTHSSSGTVTYPTDNTVGPLCSYNSSSSLVCNIPASSITSNTGYCADTFASPNNLTSIVAGKSAATLTYSAAGNVGCYAITLDVNDGTTNGSPTILYKKPSNTTWYNEKTCTITVKTLTSVASKTGYAFKGYYTAASGGTQCVNSEGLLSTSSSCNFNGATTLYSQFTANCNKITLNANGGTTATTAVLYKKTGASGWFTDNTCKTVYTTTSSVIPRRIGYTFRGYFSAKLADTTSNVSNGSQYIQTNGASASAGTLWMPTAATTIYAAWAKNCTSPDNGTCTLGVTTGGVVTYTTSCNNGYTLSNGSTATPTCTSGFWNGGGSGSCGDVVNINFWGLNASGQFVSLTRTAKPTFTNSTRKWKSSSGTVATTFESLGVSIPTISTSITVDGTRYANGVKPYRGQWVGGEPTSMPDGIIATSTVCSSNMDSSRDIALNGSLPDITSAIQNYATEAHYVILYAAECVDPTGATLGSTCSLNVSNGGATYSNACLTGTGNPSFWNATQSCQSYAVHQMQQGQCAL